MSTKSQKLQKVLNQAKQDLEKWLKFANVDSVDEFYLNQEKIKNVSYHKYYDIIEHLDFIKKIEVQIGKN